MMATGNDQGDIALWDMEKQQLTYTLPSAHDGAVTSMTFFPGEPVLLTASVDNSIKVPTACGGRRRAESDDQI